MRIKLDKGKWIKRLVLLGIIALIFLSSGIITLAMNLKDSGGLNNQKIVIVSFQFIIAIFNSIVFIKILQLRKFDSIMLFENGFFVDNARVFNRGNKISVKDIEEIKPYRLGRNTPYSGNKEEFKIKLKGDNHLNSFTRQIKKKDLYVSDLFVSTEELISVVEKLKTEANKS